jgi:hypothetical protein
MGIKPASRALFGDSIAAEVRNRAADVISLLAPDAGKSKPTGSAVIGGGAAVWKFRSRRSQRRTIPATIRCRRTRTTFICSNAAGLYVCNTAGQIEGIARIPNAFAGRYFGISWLPGGAELVLGHDPGQPDVEYGDEAAILTRQNSRLSIGQRYVEIALSSPHQITATPDGRILIANTARNGLTVLRPDGTFHHIWFDGYEWDRYSTDGEEGSHFNSVLWRDGLVYMLAHNHQRGSYGSRRWVGRN